MIVYGIQEKMTYVYKVINVHWQWHYVHVRKHLFCWILYVHSSIAIILMGKRELVALLNLSSWCLVMVEWLFLLVPWGCLRFVIVVFPDHTHLLFLLVMAILFVFPKNSVFRALLSVLSSFAIILKRKIELVALF